MPRYDSPNWITVDEEGHQVCKKHMIPMIPCPACMCNGGDEDLEVIFSSAETMFAADEGVPLRDLVSSGIDLKKVNVILA